MRFVTVLAIFAWIFVCVMFYVLRWLDRRREKIVWNGDQITIERDGVSTPVSKDELERKLTQ